MLRRPFLAAATLLVLPAGTPQTPAGPPVTIRQVSYSEAPTHNGPLRLVADLYVPAGPARGAVVLAHGGAFTTGSHDLEENQVYGAALAARGFIAAAIAYRLHKDAPIVDGWARRYADTVRRSPNPRIREAIAQRGSDWADAVAAGAVDVAAAVTWLRGHAGELRVDPDRVAVFGASAGAISAATVAYAMDDYGARPPGIAAVIDLRGLLLHPGGVANPIRRGDPPLMILHGEADERVPPAFADALFAAAGEAGVPVEYATAPGFGHELGGRALLALRHEDDTTVLDRIDAFLSRAFGGRLPERTRVRERLRAPSDLSAARLEVLRAARALVASVGEQPGFVESLYGISRRGLLLHDFGHESRADWSYWPRRRAGLPLRHMTAGQRAHTQALLASVLSAKGYLQVNHVMLLEELLAGLETTGFSRGVEDYTVSLFGVPADDAPWAFRFEGHHVSLNVTMTPDALGVTPSFIGAAPATLATGARAGFNPLRYEQHAAFALLASLGPEQRRQAILSDTPPAEILGTQFQVERDDWDRWRSSLRQDGVPASTFDPVQRGYLRRLLDEITGTYRPEIRASSLAAIDLATLSFAWMGTTQPGRPHYFRIQGADFVFELDSAQDEGNHVHAVWRDRRGDLGAHALERHYGAHPHPH